MQNEFRLDFWKLRFNQHKKSYLHFIPGIDDQIRSIFQAHAISFLLVQCPTLNLIKVNRTSRLFSSNINSTQNTSVNCILRLLLSLLCRQKVILLYGGHCRTKPIHINIISQRCFHMNVDTGAISSADRDMCEFNIGKKPFYACRKNAPCSKALFSCYRNNAINKIYRKIPKNY